MGYEELDKLKISPDCDDYDLTWIIAKPLAQGPGESVWSVYCGNHNANILGAVLRVFRKRQRFVAFLVGSFDATFITPPEPVKCSVGKGAGLPRANYWWKYSP